MELAARIVGRAYEPMLLELCHLVRAAALPPGASLALGRYRRRILGADLLILAAPSPSPQIRRAFELATDVDAEPDARGTGSLGLSALPSLGLTVKGASHAILR